MKRGLKIVVSWLCLFSLFMSPMSVFGATSSSDPVWPNPGATQLSKTAKPTENPGEWEITLKVEGKNLKTSSDVVLVIDKSESMNDKVKKQKKMDKAKEAANKFVDNLLLNGADTQIAVVAFNRTSELVSSFKGPNQKAALKAAINGIKADDGTNIQAGIKQAHELLSSNQSQAKNKIIVLLSDGEPTYSYKGITAADYSWSNNGYDSSYSFAITAFDYDNIVGNGKSFQVDYGFGEWIWDYWFLGIGHYQYEVKDNGIGTFSEAKLAKEAGHKLFSVGLDVEKNSNAEKVLNNIKSEGYYSASNEDLNKIFGELAGKISYAAQDAKVIDPMGDMFNLKMQGKQISVQDYTVSQGKVDWDPVTEKFIWNIGNIAEGEPAVFTYKVVLDPSKNPVSNTLYPTNGKTTLEYKDVNNRNTSKDFEVPKVSIGNGSILMKGYKVNADGHPVNAEGIEVEGPEFAEVLYSEFYKDQTGNEALPIGSKEYSVPAKEVASYQLKVGENPTKVRLTATNPTPVIWFGYEEVVDRTVTVKFLEKDTKKQLAEPVTVSGKIGETLSLEAVNVTDYTPVNATAQYTVKAEDNEYIFYYTSNERTVTVKFLEKDTKKQLAEPVTVSGKIGETLNLEAVNVTDYTPENATAQYTVKAEGNEYIFYYTSNERTVTVKFLEKDTKKQLAEPVTVSGKIGETLKLEAVDVTDYTPENATAQYTVKPEGNEYIFYYTSNERTVTVKFLEKDTKKKLAEPVTVSGKIGETLNLEAVNVTDYTPVNATAQYTVKAEGNEYIFYYTSNERTVTVKFMEKGTTNELADPVTRSGKIGQTLSLEAVNVTDYTPENATAEYTVKPEGNEYIFYYTSNSTEPDDNRTVTVRYVDKDTQKDLKPSQPYTGKVGEVLTLTATDYTDSVTGVVYKPHTYEAPYMFTEDQVQHFVFDYTQDKSSLDRSVTIHHVDLELNEELIAPTTELGYAGHTLVLYPEPISVTDAVYYPAQLEYGFEITLDPVQEFTIYYTKGEPTDLAQLTVSYLDRETRAELAAPEMIKGRIGDKIDLTAKEVLGYTPETVKYTHEFIDDPNQAHVFFYTKNAPADRQLTVKYLENGTNQQLASPTVVTGKPGETKTLTALSVTGYTPVKSTDTYTFNDEEGQEFIFYYTRNSSNPGGSDNSGDSGNSGNSEDSGNPTPPSTPEVTPLPPLPAVPPTLDTENHFQYIHGYPDGTVKPLNNITREEVATIFYRLLEDESRSAYLKTGTDLSDVEAKRWSNPYISTMENAGIVTGYPNGTFKPGQYITRAEFAAIASRFDKLDERPNDMFTDIKGHWAEKYIASAANKGWINGYTDGTFKPDQYITRAEAAKFINSVLNRKVDADGLHEDAKMWPDNAQGMWYFYEILEATNHHDYSREESEVEVWQEVKSNRIYP